MAFNKIDSRFRLSTPILTRNGDKTFGVMKKFKFMDRTNLDETDIKRYVVQPNRSGRPDLIANDIYSDSNLFWILIFFNKVENPLSWPTNGEIIEYPRLNAISVEL